MQLRFLESSFMLIYFSLDYLVLQYINYRQKYLYSFQLGIMMTILIFIGKDFTGYGVFQPFVFLFRQW
jgi:hypothetical protein